MTNCTQESFEFPVLKRRIVEANFQGGDITSDGGVLLLQQVDRRLGLNEAVARTLDDPRRQASVDHDGLSLLRQRVYALALGYEDRNDHETLRLDLAIQTALGRTEELASSSTPVYHLDVILSISYNAYIGSENKCLRSMSFSSATRTTKRAWSK